MNIVIRELRASRKSLAIWGLVMVAFVLMSFAEFAAYYKNPEMLALIEAMPPAMIEAFGMDEADLTTVSGYVSVLVIFFNLALGIHAVSLGHGIIAKEERDKTAGFLLTLPITRRRVVSGKLAAAVINCAVLLAAVVGAIFLAVLRYEVEADFPAYMALVACSTFILQLIFLSLGMLLAVAIRRHKVSGNVGSGLIFGLYLGSILADLSEQMSFLKHISPFSFFPAGQLLREMRLEPLQLVLSVAFTLLALLGAYLLYDRRDLYV